MWESQQDNSATEFPSTLTVHHNQGQVGAPKPLQLEVISGQLHNIFKFLDGKSLTRYITGGWPIANKSQPVPKL